MLTERQFSDVRQAYHLLFGHADTRFAAFREGYAKAGHDPRVRESEARVREVLSAHDA